MKRQVHADWSEVRLRAKALREQGYTYTEICSRLGPIPQGTLSYWLRKIRLTTQQRARIQAKITTSGANGRPLAKAAWARKIRQWQETIEARVKELGALPYLDGNIGKLGLGIMYLCEGGKYPSSRHLIFGNSDPAMIRAFLTLLRRNYVIDESRLRVRVTHRWDQNGSALVEHWSQITNIPREQFYPPYADRRTKASPTRRLDYKGICVVQYGDTNIQYELQAIGEAVLKQNNNMVEQTGIEPVTSTLPASRSPN